jgi:hypothetical protein
MIVSKLVVQCLTLERLGRICRLPSKTVPSGWTQAASWARYSAAYFGGDSCGRWKDGSGSADFANKKVTHHSAGEPICWCYYSCDECPANNYCVYMGNGMYRNHVVQTEVLEHFETDRVEVGIY